MTEKEHKCKLLEKNGMTVLERKGKSGLVQGYTTRLNDPFSSADFEVIYCPYCGDNIDDREDSKGIDWWEGTQ